MRGFTAEYYNWTSHGEESVPEYFEAATVPPVSEEPTPAAHIEANNHPHWGDEQHMDWALRMVFYAVGPSYFSSSHDGVPDDGTRSCPLDADRSEYCYGGGPYDYESRYLPLTPHLQRLYSSRATVEHMMWHATHQTDEGSVCHPSDAEAWKNFDQMYPNFAEEPPYNLPPGMCMSSEYMFLTMIIPGLSNPKRLIVVYLKSLIEELLQLWHVGVRTSDHATYNEFIMRAALMWTVNDLPAYRIASGWSTTGVMGCLYG
ncbi:UNVERIFIED_CONTAM: hypothetical protein Slati_4227500 [Sesamum latifolium]|uniref:Uncharacterized protein n=1 Tax=Sesamum latifolium TaxID=2727402 RepID=A0AAW2TAQ1_9LAMI